MFFPPSSSPSESAVGVARKNESKGIIHRDIKPSNIIFSREKIGIVDFGQAVINGQSRHPYEGTYYRAPEQRWDGETYKTDVYSLAKTIQECSDIGLNGKTLREVLNLMLVQNPALRISTSEIRRF